MIFLVQFGFISSLFLLSYPSPVSRMIQNKNIHNYNGGINDFYRILIKQIYQKKLFRHNYNIFIVMSY
jgi:hypothetical protein